MLKPHALAVLALSFSAGTLAAQTTPPFVVPDVDPDYDVLDWPNGPEWQNAGSFGRWVAASITTATGGDAVGLRGDSLYLMEGFQFLESVVPFDGLTTMDMSGRIYDVAVLEGAGTGGRAAVLTRDSVNGLVAHVFVPPIVVPTFVAGSFTSTVIDAGVAWKNSGSLIVHGNLIVGSRAKKLRSYTYDPGNGTYTVGTPVLFGNTIQDFTVGDFDADHLLDLAAYTVADEVEIRPADGTSGPTPLSMKVDAMASISNPAGGELLVLAYDDSGGSQWLQTRTTSSVKQDFRLQVAPYEHGTANDLDVYALVSGNYVEGLMDGLIVAHRSFAQSIVLLRDYVTMEFSEDLEEHLIQRVPFEAGPSSTPVLTNVGIPTFWSDELYERNVIVYPADSLDAVARTTSPAVAYIPLGFGGGTNTMRKCTYTGGSKQLTIHFKVPNQVNTNIGYYEYLKVVLFRQDVEGEDVTPVAMHYWFPLPAMGALMFPDGSNRKLKVTLPMVNPAAFVEPPDDWSANGPVFWTSTSFIKAAGNGATSTAVFGWRLNHQPGVDTGYENYLVTLPYYLTTKEVVDGDLIDPGDGGYSFGMMGMSTRMPAFTPQVPAHIPGDEAVPD